VRPPAAAAERAGLPAALAGAGGAPLGRRELERAIAADPFDHAAHARLAELTGRAPRTPPVSLRECIERAERHPYDPRALLRAGEWLARAGRDAEAMGALEAVVSLADLDPAAADAALALLPTLAPEWRQRRIVQTHVFVDAPVREQPGWRFAVRSLWLDASVALEPLLGVRFVVTALDAFDGAGFGSALEPMLAALEKGGEMQQRSGLIAWLTGAAAPEGAAAKRGVADYLGRHLVVRWTPVGGVHRALAHEIVHLFGGIHVVEEVDSLMNVGGHSRHLDALNADIVRAIAPRGFGGGGIAADVLPRIDRRRAIEAFEAALRVNLAYRKLDLDALSAGSLRSRRPAASGLHRATALDAHMADVSSFVAKLHWVEGRRDRAVALFEVAAHLYGARTPRGREAQRLADELREALRAEL
jgi:tetratricopeptide (TPR) repeat protein